MTVIRPNSISGINSITGNGGDINLFRADGTKADIPIVNNITAGVITATTFVGNLTGNPTGSGANLTNLPAANLTGTLPAIDGSNLTGLSGVSVANQADNRLITATGTTDALNAESSITYDGTKILNISSSAGGFYQGTDTDGGVGLLEMGNGDVAIQADTGNSISGSKIHFFLDGSEKARITSDGHVLCSGLTTKNDPRNTNGITLKSTAGVSFQNFGANGSRNWRIRPDDQSRWGDLDFSVSPTANSATDWPDAASDKVLTLGYDGTVTKPRQPMVSFTVDSTMISGNYMSHNSVLTNNGNHYNTGTSKFTCPVAGFYYASIMVMSNNSDTTMDIELRKNGSNASNILVPYSAATGGSYNQAVGSCIIDCAANDYLQFKLNSGSVYGGRHSNITFCLLA